MCTYIPSKLCGMRSCSVVNLTQHVLSYQNQHAFLRKLVGIIIIVHNMSCYGYEGYSDNKDI